MPDKLQIMLAVLLTAYGVIVGWYVRGIIVARRKSGEDKSSSPSSSDSSSSVKRKRSRHTGKKCPDCKNVIDVRRAVCQHCGHKFELEPGVEPHPDELKALGKAAAIDQGKDI